MKPPSSPASVPWRPRSGPHGLLPARLPWPLPALLAWALGWLAYGTLRQLGLQPAVAWLAGVLAGALVAAALPGSWRRTLVVAGFPLSSLALGAAVAPWAWLVAAALLLAAYPLRAWRDAPLFPTPAGALQGLAAELPLPAGARVLDAGCGLGQGLRALHALWPRARIEGVEWSLPLAWLCALRCPFAQVRRADLWRRSWRGVDLVYLFQRPESMARAWHKACDEMAAGSWMVSLEFPVPDVAAALCLPAGGDRSLWVYRIGGASGPG